MAFRTYDDFNLRFGFYNPDDRTYKVWVEGQTPGGGSMQPDHAPALTYDPAKFWDDPDSGWGGFLGGLEDRSLEESQMYALGSLLADQALPAGEVRDLFKSSLDAVKRAGKSLRLRLYVDPVPLRQLPWEFLSLPQVTGEQKPTDFFSLRDEISIVRTDTVESSTRKLPDRDKVRIAVVLSSPRDQDKLDINEDKKAIGSAVEALNNTAGKELVEIAWAKRPATRGELQSVLEGGADIFDFGGHGIFELGSQEGKIVLEKEDYKSDFYAADQLAQLLRSQGIRLVILGACETGRRNGQDAWSGVAPDLTREQIPAVVANQFKIRDNSATLLALHLYRLVLGGAAIDEAMFATRQAIYQLQGLTNRDWGTPVLYLRESDGVLFPPPTEEERKSGATGPFVDVSHHFGTISGEAVEVEIGKVSGGTIQIKSSVDTVEKGGKFTGLKIDSLG